MATADRERQHQLDLIRRVVTERQRAAATSTWIVVLGTALLVLSGVPSLVSERTDRSITVWDGALAPLGFAILAVHLVTALGSMWAGRNGDREPGAHRVLAVFAALTVLTVVIIMMGAAQRASTEVAPGLLLTGLVAGVLVAAHVGAARERRG